MRSAAASSPARSSPAWRSRLNKTAKEYSRYGSTVHKQVYVYGSLDPRPIELNRSFGMAWGVGGWLLTPFLQKIGRPTAQKLRERVVAELKTTFASHYTQGGLAAGGAAAREHRRLQQARHRREIPDQPEQGLTTAEGHLRPKHLSENTAFTELGDSCTCIFLRVRVKYA